MSKKGGGTASSTVSTEPAEFIAPYLTQAAKGASNLYSTYRPEYFTGSTFVPFSPETETALQAQTARAMGGSPLTQTAQDQQLATIRGDYLSGSPALQQELDRIAGQVSSRFAGGGGYRSSANQEVLAREMSDAALRNYQTERGMQQQAAQAAPTLAAQDYQDIAALQSVGAQREDLFSKQLQDQLNRFNFYQTTEPQALDDFIRRIGTLSSGYATQTTTQPTAGSSFLGNALNLGGLVLDGIGGLSSLFGGGATAAAPLTSVSSAKIPGASYLF